MYCDEGHAIVLVADVMVYSVNISIYKEKLDLKNDPEEVHIFSIEARL